MPDDSNWARPSDKPTRDLGLLLDYARSHYVSHTDWFLRHKESGINTLGVVLTAEFAILGFYFAGNLHRIVALAGLFLLASLTLPLTKLALLSCKKAFQAALEHALLITKIVWAMGWAEKVAVDQYQSGDCPAQKDESLYVERYLQDARGKDEDRGKIDTEKFIRNNLRKTDSTYYATRITLILMGTAAAVVGLGGMIAVFFVNGKAG